MSSLDYPLTTMARAAVFASNGLSLTHNSPGRGTSLLLMIPIPMNMKIVLMAPSLLQRAVGWVTT